MVVGRRHCNKTGYNSIEILSRDHEMERSRQNLPDSIEVGAQSPTHAKSLTDKGHLKGWMARLKLLREIAPIMFSLGYNALNSGSNEMIPGPIVRCCLPNGLGLVLALCRVLCADLRMV